MSRNYFSIIKKVFFVTFAVIDWNDLFTRQVYTYIVMSALDYSRKNKGIEVFGWCIMLSHFNLFFAALEKPPHYNPIIQQSIQLQNHGYY